jgi:membrane dipeptidase
LIALSSGEHIMRATFCLIAALLTAATPAFAQAPEQIAAAALKAAPVWDGHNDVPEQLRDRRQDMIADFDFRDTTHTAQPAKTPGGYDFPAMHTDLTRLHQGHVGAQFWSVYVSAQLPEPQAVQATLEQIDVMKRLIARYPTELQFATSADDVARAMKAGRIASLLGMEGGHSIGGSLAVLRQMYALGARYMTLTHFKNNAWADSATDAPAHNGLTPFGRDVVREMQRIGMLVDLSHVSAATMRDALAVAKAPVMFSHSGAYAVDASPRNAPDDMLMMLKANGGIIMVNTYPFYVSEEVRHWKATAAAEEARQKSLNPGDPAAAKAALTAWEAANPRPASTIPQVADHIDHIAKLIGVDHVGLGGDFDGIEVTTQGMQDVSTYPALLTELARRGWSVADLEKLTSGNMMRVLRAVEAYAAVHRDDPPIESATVF